MNSLFLPDHSDHLFFDFLPHDKAIEKFQNSPTGNAIFGINPDPAIEKFFQNSSTERKKRRLAGRSGILKEFRAGANDALRAGEKKKFFPNGKPGLERFASCVATSTGNAVFGFIPQPNPKGWELRIQRISGL